jgi:Leucine-rich repeat (LRR) protein
LDISHNYIVDIDTLKTIKASCTTLKELGFKCNPLADKKSYRSMIFGVLNKLVKLDGFIFSDKDKESQ